MATQAQVQTALEAAVASAVSVKLPPFWPDKTDIWFAQAEAQFTIKNITTEKTKYAYVVSVLDSDTATQVLDIIRAPPAEEPYKALKNRLTKAFAISDRERAAKLLDMNGLGDKTPSQCLTTMLNLVPDAEAQDPGFLFREIFLRQLPNDVQTQLAQSTRTGTSATELRALALEADKYFSSIGSRISTISRMDESANEDFEVNAVSNRQFCYYHSKFGDKATKCRSPCQFKSAMKPGAATSSNQGNSRSGRGHSN